MRSIIDTITGHLQQAEQNKPEVLISTWDGVPLCHNFIAEDPVDDLAAIASAMLAFRKKIAKPCPLDYVAHSFVELDTQEFVYVIGSMVGQSIYLLRVPHANDGDRTALISESRIAIEKAHYFASVRQLVA